MTWECGCGVVNRGSRVNCWSCGSPKVLKALKAQEILAIIVFSSMFLFIIVGSVTNYIKNRDREFQDLVLISGVIDSFETVAPPPRVLGAWLFDMIFGTRLYAKIMGLPIDESGHLIQSLRLRLQGDPHRYEVGRIVFEGFNWEKFSANESVGTRVSLKVERANLSQWSPSGRQRRVMVYGLESRRGTYLTPEGSLSNMRANDFLGLIFGSGFFLILLFHVWVFLCWKPRGINRPRRRWKPRRIRQNNKGRTRDPFILP